MNPILQRQLERLGLTDLIVRLPALIDLVSETYTQFQDEIDFIEHSMFTLSEELNDKNIQLANQVKTLEKIRLEEQKSRVALDSTFNATGEATFSFDADGNLQNLNKKAKYLSKELELKQPVTEEILFKSCFQHAEDESIFLKVQKQITECYEGQIDFGTHHFYEFHIAPMIVNSEIHGRVWCFKDISNQRQVDEIVKYQALHDTLTGLPNRTALESVLNETTASHNSSGNTFALVHLDFCNLNQLKDTYDLEIIDRIIIDLSHQLLHLLKDEHLLFRLGATELGVLLRNFENRQQIKVAVEELVQALSMPQKVEDLKFYIRSKFGVSVFREDGHEPHVLMASANVALGHAKTSGKIYQFYSAEIEEQRRQRKQVEHDLRDAFDNDEFELFLQPKVQTKTMRIVGAESLIRWIKPDGSIVPPNVFIPIAERAGMIQKIGQVVVEKACQYLEKFRGLDLEHLSLSINITAADLTDLDLVNRMCQCAEQHQANPQKLIIEVTESLFMSEKDQTKKIMLQLKSHGFPFALDDFGTGYSSLSYLQELPFSYLKIDRAFLKNVIGHQKKEKIIQSIIDIGRNLNLVLVAEGVETQQELDFIRFRTNNSVLVQGFYFYRPMPFQDFIETLKRSCPGGQIVET